MAAIPHSVWRFGAGFELDPQAWELHQGGTRLRLERVPMQILLLLIGQRGECVSRASLSERIWGRQATFDTGPSIDRALQALRATLGDDPAQPRFIQGEDGAGYRFIAAVTEVTAAPRIAASAPPAVPPRPPAPPLRAWIVGTLSLAVLAIETVFFMRLSYPTAAAPAVMLAVLPLSNLTGNPDGDYLSDALTEELITQLGRLDPAHLAVIARTSVMSYKNTHQSAAQIARALNAQYLLEGSVGRDGEQLRISAQLLRASDDASVWTGHYERPASSVLGLRDEIARTVAEELGGTLHPARSPPSVRAVPLSPAQDLPTS